MKILEIRNCIFVSHRPAQIAEEIKRIVAESLPELVEFPPQIFATVVGAQVSADLQQGTVWLTFYPETFEHDALQILRNTRSKIQHHLASHLPIKHVPRLHFKLADQKWFDEQQATLTIL